MANEPRKGNPLDMLYQIVNDLWPGSAPKAVQKPESEEAGQAAKDFVDTYMAKTADVLGNPPEAPAPAVQATEPEPAVVSGPPPFEEYWRRADERIEWTEVLTSDRPVDGLTDTETWQFLHERAERVLSGDLAAYGEVLKRLDPLADLKHYAGHVTVAAPDSDRVTVFFEALPEQQNTVEDKRLLAGLSLRCARDVMALLPVSTVEVSGKLADGAAITVCYPRDPLRKARFGFLDPVAFAEELGAEFKPDKTDTSRENNADSQ